MYIQFVFIPWAEKVIGYYNYFPNNTKQNDYENMKQQFLPSLPNTIKQK